MAIKRYDRRRKEMEEALAKNPHTLRRLQNIETESEQDAGFMPWWVPTWQVRVVDGRRDF